jgi:hypothetical protein
MDFPSQLNLYQLLLSVFLISPSPELKNISPKTKNTIWVFQSALESSKNKNAAYIRPIIPNTVSNGPKIRF